MLGNSWEKYDFRLVGVSPDQAVKQIIINEKETKLQNIKETVKKEFELNPILDIQFIFHGKVISDITQLSRLRLKPNDKITVMAVQYGGGTDRQSLINQIRDVFWQITGDTRYLGRVDFLSTKVAGERQFFDQFDKLNRNDKEDGKTIHDVVRLLQYINGLNPSDFNLDDDEFNLLKQDLFAVTFAWYFKNDIEDVSGVRERLNILKNSGISNELCKLAEEFSKFAYDYHLHEKEFQMIAITQNDPRGFTVNGRPFMWSSSRVSGQMKSITYELTSQKDFITGEPINWRDSTYKGKIVRHHWKTAVSRSPEIRKKCCRISDIIPLKRDIENKIHNAIDADPSLGLKFEKFFRQILSDLLQGKPPRYWDQTYKDDFNLENTNGQNYRAIKYFYFDESIINYRNEENLSYLLNYLK
ncbi:MAG: hypothetical protein GF317_03590 [Candidatus Lokiarchaeota archaeon]|nr:hypothetical protein [Candidatus Lokiarchaeota archaeon]MBD3198970.1 hypothetical protein [Candidatus Lokiarchaeota archaeon]